MNQEKMHLINKIFNNETIRTVWAKEDEKYYISVVDVVGILSESKDGKYRLTDVWKDGGITEDKEYKGLRKESLRDNMSDIEIAFADIGELTTRELAKKHKPIGLEENRKVARASGEVAKNTRMDIEQKLGELVVRKDNKLSYKYIDNKRLQEKVR